MPELREIMRAQRACRRFDHHGDVPDSDIEQILNLAVYAPSGENTQPWSFVVVRAEQNRKLLADWWTESWGAGGRAFIEQRIESQQLVNDLEYGFSHSGGFAAAPVVIVVCADTERVDEIHVSSPIYPAVQNLLLAADLGYGTCLTTGLTIFGIDQARELLDYRSASSRWRPSIWDGPRNSSRHPADGRPLR